MIRSTFATVSCLALLMPLAVAQDSQRMNSVVVTGARIDTDDMRALPNVFRRVPADFILVDVVFSSATRDAATRRKELETMYNRVLAAAAATPEISLQSGEAGVSMAPIETTLFSDVYTTGYGNMGNFSLVLSVDTREGDTFERVLERGQAFVDAIPLEGRVEAYLQDEQYLGAREINKHRTALLKDMNAEVSELRRIFPKADVIITGLESRVITQPTGPLELDIFLPYTLTLETR